MHPDANRATLLQILDVARWAPSGDNTQVWRFEITGDMQLAVHGFDTREQCVYDFEGHASQLSLGALIENIVLAAGSCQWSAAVTRRLDAPVHRPSFDIRFAHAAGVAADPLAAFITKRCVQRRPLQMRALTAEEKSALEQALGPDHRVVWFEGYRNRLRIARLLFENAGLRLTMPEAYPVHRRIIRWHARFSEDRVPDQALGADPLTLCLMEWAMQSWERLEFLDKYLAGTLMPRIQMDFIPGVACAAHFALTSQKRADSIDGFIAAGRAMQRFWLTATRLGLQMQPEMTPLIFSSYVRAGVRFSRTAGLWERALQVSRGLERLLGADVCDAAVFLGRIGAGRAPHARSTRLPLSQLMVEPSRD